MSWQECSLEMLIDLHDHRRIPLSGVEREKRQGEFRYYGAQGVIDHIDAYIFDGEYVLVAEDGENLRSRKQPIAQIASGQFWVNNHAHILQAKEGVSNSAFICALLNWIDISPFVTGAAQPKLSQGSLKTIKVRAPDAGTQLQIATVLSAYDDLIATNQRRIALLEDAARRLYREWFVHLRFPGHESVPVKDGVPEGWRFVAIGECFCFHIGGGWGKEFSESGSSEAAYVIRGTDLPRIRDGELGGVPLRFHPEKNLASRRLKPGDIVFEVSGGSRDQGVGRLLHVTSRLLNQFDSPAMCASFCKLIRPKRGLSEFLACTLEYLRITAALKSFENQSASNIVNFAFSEFCEKQSTLVPAEMVLHAFRCAVGPFSEQAAILARQNAQLAQARDRLLPKLMSGQLDVSGIRLPLEAAA